MNILLWILQVLLALWNLTGAFYMMGHYEVLAKAWALADLPKPFWILYGILQILFALGLLLPKLAARSAIGLALLVLLGIALFAQYSGAGLLWAFIPAALLAFVAYGRGSLKPFKK
ncbi:MAG TPA: hypothetical protein VMU88_05725 [bacterium]|nr:hypothetical protein [bacterium]